jgi:hypothetical protein
VSIAALIEQLGPRSLLGIIAKGSTGNTVVKLLASRIYSIFSGPAVHQRIYRFVPGIPCEFVEPAIFESAEYAPAAQNSQFSPLEPRL